MIFVVLAMLGVECHERPRRDGVTRCETELAKCQAVEAFGTNTAEDIAESRTPSSASKGALECRRIAWHAWAT